MCHITDQTIWRKIKHCYIYLDLKPCITSEIFEQKEAKPIDQQKRLWYNNGERWMGDLPELSEEKAVPGAAHNGRQRSGTEVQSLRGESDREYRSA